MNRAHSMLVKYWQRPRANALKDNDYGLGDELRLLTIRGLTLEILKPASELATKAHAFLDVYYPLFREAAKYRLVDRMKSVGQLGFHTDRRPGHRYPHTRFDHSKFVSAEIIALGLHLNWPFHEIAIGVLATLFHDVGHPAYTHDADYLLIELGMGDHEDRGQEALRKNAGLCNLLARKGFSVDKIIKIMEEKGSAGVCQSIVDTLSYVVLDASMFGVEIPQDFSWHVISSIIGMRNDTLVVNDTEPLKKMLDIRASLYRLVYRSPSCRVGSASLGIVLRKSFAKGHLTPEEVAWETDSVLDGRLSEMFENGVGPMVRSAWGLVQGRKEELNKWKIRYSKKNDPMRDQKQLAFEGYATLYVPWYDHAQKTIEVRTENGEKVSLKGNGDSQRAVDHHAFRLDWIGE